MHGEFHPQLTRCLKGIRRGRRAWVSALGSRLKSHCNTQEEDGHDEVVPVALEVERVYERFLRLVIVECSTGNLVPVRVHPGGGCHLRVSQVGSVATISDATC
jgi:hypothetical protein